MSICSVDNCEKLVHARGWCKYHYKKLYLWKPHYKKVNIIDRFDEFISYCPTTGCHLWTGPCDPHGYGYVCRDCKKIFAHRFAMERACGLDMNSSMLVLHKCDTPSCVNPDHLYIGTTNDNVRDMHLRGRAKGLIRGLDDHPKAKITSEVAISARQMHKDGICAHDIASAIGLGYRSTCYLLSGKTWRL